MNTTYFDRKNKEIEEKIHASEEERRRTQKPEIDPLEVYEGYLKNDKEFRVQFESCGRDGTFVGSAEGNILIIMRGESTIEHLPYFAPRLQAKLMGYEFEVKVVQVDREKRRVYVESARSSERALKNASKTELVGNLINALSRQEKPRVWGKVKSIQGDQAYVDIFGENVTGIIRTPYWQKSYLRYLSTVCQEGEYYPFDVVGMFKHTIPGKAPLFVLNREEIADNPWDNIPVDVLKEGALIYVKCIEKPEGNKCWWGNSLITPYIEILGLYPGRNKSGQRLQIIPGLTYKCKIRRITQADQDERGQNSFVVMPFAVTENDAKEYARMIQMEQTKILMDEQAEDVERMMEQETEDGTSLELH